MLNARQSIDAPVQQHNAEIVVFPRAAAATDRAFGRCKPRRPFTLVIDLAEEEMGWRWCRGAATLALLCGAALLLAPGFEPLAAAEAGQTEVERGMQLSTLGGEPSPAVAPSAPPEPQVRGIRVGERNGLQRIGGDVSGGLYWSLRGAGVSSGLAADYLKAIASQSDVGDVAPFDRFDLVVEKDGERLVYAALHKFQGEDVEVLRWKNDGQSGWLSAGAVQPATSTGLMAPVAGRITSNYGSRRHPILRYTRFHGGVDFGARWGSPIVAAADGQVVAAGWAGGYGRQVRVAHGSGIVTSYSHMSEIAAAPGSPVRQGQVIGYVGSSGLSTGPHLHFEVKVDGRPVDPLSARLVQRPALEGRALAGFKARLKQLQAIPVAPLPAPSI